MYGGQEMQLQLAPGNLLSEVYLGFDVVTHMWNIPCVCISVTQWPEFFATNSRKKILKKLNNSTVIRTKMIKTINSFKVIK